MSKVKSQKSKIKNIATCVGCGCTDEKGCPVNDEGYSCTWIKVDYKAEVGICSRCVTRDNSNKFKCAVERYNSRNPFVNRREFLSAQKRIEGRCE